MSPLPQLQQLFQHFWWKVLAFSQLLEKTVQNCLFERFFITHKPSGIYRTVPIAKFLSGLATILLRSRLLISGPCTLEIISLPRELRLIDFAISCSASHSPDPFNSANVADGKVTLYDRRVVRSSRTEIFVTTPLRLVSWCRRKFSFQSVASLAPSESTSYRIELFATMTLLLRVEPVRRRLA